jgi:hypothetical protein
MKSYIARANEERRLAMAAADSKVRAVHLEMAARYAVLAGGDPVQVPIVDEERKTA